MAWIELWQSQEIRETAEGTEFRRTFKVDRADWNNGTFPYRIGQSLSWDNDFPFTPITNALLITDMTSVPTQNTEVLNTEVLYSTNARNKAFERPDQIASWEVSGGASLTEKPLDTWVTANTTIEKKTLSELWATVTGVEENEEGELVPAVPVIYVDHPAHSFNITLYGGGLYIYRLKSRLGHINSNENFLSSILMLTDLEDDTNSDKSEATTFTDTYQWKFSDMRYSRVRRDCWRFDLTFEEFPLAYKGTAYNWNEPYGDKVKIGANNFDLNYYKESDLVYLLNGMQNVDPESNLGTE